MKNPMMAAQILVERRVAGISGNRLPEACRPENLEDGLAVQMAVTEVWCEQQDDSIGAWKCLLPVGDKIVAAPIYTRTIDSIPPVALWPRDNFARIEPELAFFIGQDLPARAEPYTAEEIDAAICRTHLALELIHSRYADPAACSFPEMLADGLVNQGLFIGPPVDGQLAAQASEFGISLAYEGHHSNHKGRHPNGPPRTPLYWLVEFLRSRGQGLVAGQAVITGSYAGVLEVPLNTAVTLVYEGLGEMQVSFSARQSF